MNWMDNLLRHIPMQKAQFYDSLIKRKQFEQFKDTDSLLPCWMATYMHDCMVHDAMAHGPRKLQA